MTSSIGGVVSARLVVTATVLVVDASDVVEATVVVVVTVAAAVVEGSDVTRGGSDVEAPLVSGTSAMFEHPAAITHKASTSAADR